MEEAGRVWGCLGPMMGLRLCPQGLRLAGRLAKPLSGVLPTPWPPARGRTSRLIHRTSTGHLQVWSTVLRAWGCTNVEDTGLALSKVTAFGEKTSL